MLRIATIHGVPDVLRELGQNPSQVIDDLGFDPTLFDDPDNRITLAERGRLVEHCATVSGCPHFGLLVGQKDGLDQLGIVGLLARHAPDVGTALRRLIRHFHLQAQGVEIGLAVDGGRALFSYAIADEGVAGIDQVGDGAVAAQFNIMRELCGPDFKALAAWFVRPPPNALEPYRDFFQVRLRFDAPIYGLEFSSSWLTRRLPSTDEALAQLIAEKISVLENQKAEDLSENVRRLMQTALAFNHVDAQTYCIHAWHARSNLSPPIAESKGQAIENCWIRHEWPWHAGCSNIHPKISPRFLNCLDTPSLDPLSARSNAGPQQRLHAGEKTALSDKTGLRRAGRFCSLPR